MVNLSSNKHKRLIRDDHSVTIGSYAQGYPLGLGMVTIARRIFGAVDGLRSTLKSARERLRSDAQDEAVDRYVLAWWQEIFRQIKPSTSESIPAVGIVIAFDDDV